MNYNKTRLKTLKINNFTKSWFLTTTKIYKIIKN